MGCQSNQFDLIDRRFHTEHIKDLKVICSRKVQAVLDDPVQIFPFSPFTIGDIIDPTTGQLLPGVRIVATEIFPGVGILPNKVCDVFLVSFVIVDQAGTTLFGPETVTVSDAVDCPGAGIGPSQTIMQKHDIEVHFCAIPVATVNSLFDMLFVSVDIDYCLVVANETIMKVRAAQPFCP